MRSVFSAENDCFGEINIITVVSEKKPLWDTKDELYHNRDIAKKRKWIGVATDIGCESK